MTVSGVVWKGFILVWAALNPLTALAFWSRVLDLFDYEEDSMAVLNLGRKPARSGPDRADALPGKGPDRAGP